MRAIATEGYRSKLRLGPENKRIESAPRKPAYGATSSGFGKPEKVGKLIVVKVRKFTPGDSRFRSGCFGHTRIVADVESL